MSALGTEASCCHDRRAPAQRRLALAGEQQRERAVERRVDRRGRRAGPAGRARMIACQRTTSADSVRASGERFQSSSLVVFRPRSRSMNSLMAFAVAATSGTTFG